MNSSVFHNSPVYNFYPPIQKQIKISNFKVKVIDLQLFERVSLVVILIDNDGVIQDQKFYTLTGDEYKNWAEDDAFIVQYVKKQLRAEYEKTTATNVVSNFKKNLKKKSDDKPEQNLVVNPEFNSQNSQSDFVGVTGNNVVDSDAKVEIQTD
jgi:hypothetical protein